MTKPNNRSQGGGQRRLGDFILLEELGRGGMGVVYRARQESLGRIVALKVLPSFAGMDRDAVARFRREAESAARLSHPGIVPVYAVGEHEGTYYYAMELVDGPSLAGVLQELSGRSPSRLLGSLAEETTLGQRAPALLKQRFTEIQTGARYAASCASLAADIANAMAAAHNARVVHRDLKPSNVIVHPSGRPLVLDFGLARDETAVGLTRSGDAVGTPAYMAPEQACGAKDVDARADIYGLGATLYEMLALRPPFDGDNAMEIMRQIVESDPTPLSELNSRVPGDLEGIVEKCLAKDRDRRYAAMEAVELDLRAFLEGARTHARRRKAWARGTSWLRRHRRGLGVAAATTFVLSLAGVTVDMMGRARTRSDGITLLDAVGSRLRERLDVSAAQDDYVRAAQMLGNDSLVSKARRAHLDQVFQLHYGTPERRSALAALFDAAPETVRDAGWVKMRKRIAGQGTVELAGTLREDAQIELLRFDGESHAPVPGGLPADGLLDVGAYVLRSESIGMAGTSVAFTIQRDEPTVVPLPEVSIGMLRDGEQMVALASPAPEVTALARWPFGMSRTELSVAEFRALLKNLAPAQRAEFKDVKVDADSMPIHNLSHRQARLLAALAGGHLATAEEFALAARGGLPPELGVYPWGKTFASDRVAADPDRMSRPDPVDARPSGASPFGLLNLSGNVAEALAVDGELRPRFAGGHFLARSAQVTVDSVDTADAFDAPLPFAGVRVSRFLYPARFADGSVATDTEHKLDAAWKEGRPVQMTDWDFDETGRVKLRRRIAVIPGESAGEELPVMLSTPGFLQDGSVRGWFGNVEQDVIASSPGSRRRASDGSAPTAVLAGSADGESFMLRFGRGNLAPVQLHRIEIATDLRPVSGLAGRGDGYELKIPLSALPDARTVFRVSLPKGSRLDEVDPPPEACFVQGQRPVLVWWLGGDRLGIRSFPAVIRFRKDGLLSRDFAPVSEAQAVLDRLFQALRADDVDALGALLAPTFTLLPSNQRREHLLASGRRVRQWFKDYRVLDVTSVGDVHTAEVNATWVVNEDGRDREVSNWPLRVHWVRRPGGEQVLHMAAAGQRDTGRIEQGVYVHEQMRTSLRPGDRGEFVLSRTVGHLAPMQLECRPLATELAGCSLLLLGIYAHEKDRADEILSRLGDGIREVGGGQRIGALQEVAAAGHKWPCEDWVFTARGDGDVTYERWLTLEKGLRRILVRLVASAANRAAAEAQFARGTTWFNSVLSRIEIE